MITESRLKHILGVARKARILAERYRPNDDEYAQDMFVLGFLHDIGYEFSETGKGHASLGGNLLKRSGYKYADEISRHGYNTQGELSDELFILDYADMTTGPNGENFTLEQRTDEIAVRYGKDSHAHRTSLLEAQILRSDPRYEKIKD